MTRPIFFLTDFGLSDTYVGVVKAVILGIAPDARIVDLTHDVPAQDVRAGAFALLTVAPYLPPDAVVLAVVDPGVGTARRLIAVQVGGRTFVGPDNGLLSWAVSAGQRVGAYRTSAAREDGMNRAPTETSSSVGARFIPPDTNIAPDTTIVVLDRPRSWLPSVSATFHGRDMFGPVAAHLARGVPLSDLGSPGDAMQVIPFPAARRDLDGHGQSVAVHGEVVHVDRYGNLVTSLAAADLPPRPIVEITGQQIEGLAPHFQPGSATASSDATIALIGSSGLLEIAVPNGSAARALGVGVGTPVTVTTRR